MSRWRETSMFVDYRPESFCREFVELRGHATMLYNYMAVVLGVKPLLDDWIPVGRVDDFRKACEKYGLHMKTGAVWLYEASDEYLKKLSGGDSLSTTKFVGARYTPDLESGNVHVFVANSQENLERGYRSGWYPLIIDNRVVHKPYVDFIRFGIALGYPECCIDYFLRENPLGDTLLKIYSGGDEPYDYRCNCLAKDTSFSYIYHMPCSPDCPETIKYADNLRKEIKKRDPEYVDVIDRHLKLPYLCFSEQDIYAFEGSVSGNIIHTKKSYFVGKPRYNRFNDEFRKADAITVTDKEITAHKNERLLMSISKEKPNKGIIIRFGER